MTLISNEPIPECLPYNPNPKPKPNTNEPSKSEYFPENPDPNPQIESPSAPQIPNPTQPQNPRNPKPKSRFNLYDGKTDFNRSKTNNFDSKNPTDSKIGIENISIENEMEKFATSDYREPKGELMPAGLGIFFFVKCAFLDDLDIDYEAELNRGLGSEGDLGAGGL